MDSKYIIKEIKSTAEKYLGITLEENEAEQIMAMTEFKIFKKGCIVCGIKEKITKTGMVIDGIIRSYYLNAEGCEVTRNFHSKGFSFMDEGMLGYDETLCAYEAITDCNAIFVDTQKFKSLIRQSDNLKNLYIASLEYSLRYKLHRENEFLTKNATERYIQFLEDFPELSKKVRQSYISTYLGIAPESLSRIRRALKENTDNSEREENSDGEN